VTTGGVILGNCATGSDGSTTAPVSKIANEQTSAKIGRSRKNRITATLILLAAVPIPQSRDAAPGAKRRRLRRSRDATAASAKPKRDGFDGVEPS